MYTISIITSNFTSVPFIPQFLWLHTQFPGGYDYSQQAMYTYKRVNISVEYVSLSCKLYSIFLAFICGYLFVVCRPGFFHPISKINGTNCVWFQKMNCNESSKCMNFLPCTAVVPSSTLIVYRSKQQQSHMMSILKLTKMASNCVWSVWSRNTG